MWNYLSYWPHVSHSLCHINIVIVCSRTMSASAHLRHHYQWSHGRHRSVRVRHLLLLVTDLVHYDENMLLHSRWSSAELTDWWILMLLHVIPFACNFVTNQAELARVIMTSVARVWFFLLLTATRIDFQSNNKLYKIYLDVHRILPLSSQFSRRDQVIYNRIRIGHSYPTHSYLYTKILNHFLYIPCHSPFSIEYLRHLSHHRQVVSSVFVYLSMWCRLTLTKRVCLLLQELDLPMVRSPSAMSCNDRQSQIVSWRDWHMFCSSAGSLSCLSFYVTEYH